MTAAVFTNRTALRSASAVGRIKEKQCSISFKSNDEINSTNDDVGNLGVMATSVSMPPLYDGDEHFVVAILSLRIEFDEGPTKQAVPTPTVPAVVTRKSFW